MQLPIPQILETDLNCKQVSRVVSERNLLAAMLARAICDAFGVAQTEPHVRREARYWLFCELLPGKPFSFAWTALQLDLDPAIMQRALKEQSKDPLLIAEKLAILRA
jgi:hypothetical protein